MTARSPREPVDLWTRRLVFVLLVAAVAWLAARTAGTLMPFLVPVLLSLLLAGLLMPVQVLLNHRVRLPRHAAAGVTLLLAVGILGGLVWRAGASVAEGLSGLRLGTGDALGRLEEMVLDSPLPVGRAEIRAGLDRAQAWVMDNGAVISDGAARAGAGLGTVLAGGLLTLVITFFLLAEGDRLGSWAVEALPRHRRERAWEAGRRGWVTLGTYAKVQVVVSAVDAVGIGLGVWLLGLPFVVPLTFLTFLLCFIPLLGAFVSGTLVVLVALTTQGVGAALVMLAVVLAVQQLEGNVLSPLLMGRAVSLHPLVVILSVSVASYVAGLAGALFAVPLVAVVTTMMRYLSGDDMFPQLAAGGSALTGSARTLARGRQERPGAARIGEQRPSAPVYEGPEDRDHADQAEATVPDRS